MDDKKLTEARKRLDWLLSRGVECNEAADKLEKKLAEMKRDYHTTTAERTRLRIEAETLSREITGEIKRRNQLNAEAAGRPSSPPRKPRPPSQPIPPAPSRARSLWYALTGR